MQVTLVVAAIVLTIFSPVSAADCQDAEKTFADTFYDAVTEAIGDDVDNLEIDGSEAGPLYYKEVQKSLDERKQCNSDEAAYTGSLAVQQVPQLILKDYLKKLGISVGRTLYKEGVYDCSNAADLGREYKEYFVQHQDSAENEVKFVDYFHGAIYGWFDLLKAHDVKLEDVTQVVVDYLYKTLGELKPQNQCSASQSSGQDDVAPNTAAGDDADCNADKLFADSVDINSDQDLKIDGGQLGLNTYNEVQKLLKDHQVCNADDVAYKAGRAVSQIRQWSLQDYLKTVASTVPKSLSKFGVLNCENADSLSNEFNKYVHQEMSGMDDSKFGSYVHGVEYGFVDLLLAHGVKLGNVGQTYSNIYYQTVGEKKANCKVAHASDEDKNP